MSNRTKIGIGSHLLLGSIRSTAPITLALLLCFAIYLPSSSILASTSPQSAAVASAHPLATRIGIKILERGGNAFDAAVAVSAGLAVAEPYSSGLGGGGFWLLHRAKDGKQIMLDGREAAPLAARRDMYLDQNGEHDQDLSLNTPLAAAIPGLPRPSTMGNCR